MSERGCRLVFFSASSFLIIVGKFRIYFIVRFSPFSFLCLSCVHRQLRCASYSVLFSRILILENFVPRSFRWLRNTVLTILLEAKVSDKRRGRLPFTFPKRVVDKIVLAGWIICIISVAIPRLSRVEGSGCLFFNDVTECTDYLLNTKKNVPHVKRSHYPTFISILSWFHFMFVCFFFVSVVIVLEHI